MDPVGGCTGRVAPPIVTSAIGLVAACSQGILAAPLRRSLAMFSLSAAPAATLEATPE